MFELVIAPYLSPFARARLTMTQAQHVTGDGIPGHTLFGLRLHVNDHLPFDFVAGEISCLMTQSFVPLL